MLEFEFEEKLVRVCEDKLGGTAVYEAGHTVSCRFDEEKKIELYAKIDHRDPEKSYVTVKVGDKEARIEDVSEVNFELSARFEDGSYIDIDSDEFDTRVSVEGRSDEIDFVVLADGLNKIKIRTL